MIDEKQIALARYRVEQAEETLVAAKISFQNSLIKHCINRSYYVAFYSAGTKKIFA